MDRPAAPGEPGPCVLHGTPGMIRLLSTPGSDVELDLCMECFQQHAVMTARDEVSLAHLERAAPRLQASVWRHGATYYLLRDAARPLGPDSSASR